MQWFYRLGLLLFPDDWHLDMVNPATIRADVQEAAAL